MNETWKMAKLSGLSGPVSDFYILLGFHSSTKEQLHSYGPFGSMSEITEFTRLHNITLEV